MSVLSTMGQRLISSDAFRELAKKATADRDFAAQFGRPPLAKSADKIEKASDGSPIFVLSTSSPDRSNDVVSQDGWVLAAYRKNPIVLWAHDHGTPPIGRSPNTYVDGQGRLVSEAPIFAKQEENPFGAMIGKMIDAGLLNATSVGFIPLEWTWNEERGSFAMDFKRQELLEWSVVPVPANSEALIGGKAKGIDLAPMLAWASKALDEKRELPSTSRADLEAVYKSLAAPAVQVPVGKGGQDNTVCDCEAGPLVKCQECGGHKRAAVSPDSKSVKAAKNDSPHPPVDPHECDCDGGALAKCQECGGHVRTQPLVKEAAKPTATTKEELSAEQVKAIADAAAAAVKQQIDQLMGRVS